MQQMQNLDSKQTHEVIDEYFNPKKTNQNLVEIVEEEMRLAGLDPLNKDDVRKFWRTKGIEV